MRIFFSAAGRIGHVIASVAAMSALVRLLLAADIKQHVYMRRDVPDDPWIVMFSDLSIAAAHYAIVTVLVLAILKRTDTLFRTPALLFALYTGFRGTTQLLTIWTIWHPQFQMSGWIRTVTTLLSVATAVVLVRFLPAVKRLPSTVELERVIEERRKAEEAEREKEERFRNFVENVEDYAMYMIDPAGVVQTWNSGAERIKGYESAEIIGRNFELFATGEDRRAGQPKEAMRIADETGNYVWEGWRIRHDGSRFWARVNLRPLRNPDGVLRGFSEITRDLSEARELEERYQSLLEATPDAILIADQAGLLRFLNAQGEKLFGYPRAEVLGRSIDALVQWDRQEAATEYRRQLFEDPAAAKVLAPDEICGVHKDGSAFALEFSLSPLDTRDGRLFLFSLRDVTERKKSETRFRSLLESAPDAMVIVNRSGLIELVNQQTEKLFGYTRPELIGHSVDILVPVAVRAHHGVHREQFFRSPKQRAMGAGLDLEAVRRDGTRFPVEISLSPLDGPDGMSVTAAIRDVTDRKLAAQQLAEKMTQLRQSNEALEQFAHIASHDLQEPLRMVASYTQLLAKRYKGRLDADADEFIDFAVDGTRRMKALIEDLLLYSKAGKGLLPVEQISSDLCLQQALNNLFAAIHESQAQVTWDDLPNVSAVDSQLIQVFQNLIGNAIKYRGERIPEIHVSAELADKEWIFSVRDNGIGIEPRYFDRIFVIFQRLHGGTEYSGTGHRLGDLQANASTTGGQDLA